MKNSKWTPAIKGGYPLPIPKLYPCTQFCPLEDAPFNLISCLPLCLVQIFCQTLLGVKILPKRTQEIQKRVHYQGAEKVSFTACHSGKL